MNHRDTHGASFLSCRAAAFCLIVFLALAPDVGSWPDGKPQEEPQEERDEESEFISPLVGWGSDEGRDFSYAVPLFYHSRNAGDDGNTTLLFPILTGLHHSATDRDWKLHGAASVPLLALMGSARNEDFRASGFLSPYLGVGSLKYSRDGVDARWSGASLLPWLPLVDDLLQLNVYADTGAQSTSGAFGETEILSFPWLDISVYDSRSAGIEEDTRFVNIWGISLFRSGYDLPGTGFRPWFRDSDALHGVRNWGGCLERRWPSLDAVGWNGLSDALSGSRSGMPVDFTGILDPMITWSFRGEGLDSLGIEPVFVYDSDEGYSIPFLLTSFAPDGVRFGPSARHLFPIVHGNKELTRWDFLFNYGTVYALDDYTAVDLKLLFNYQHHTRKGTAWGVLPFPFGRYPGYGLDHGARFVQLDNHLLSYWNMNDQTGIDIAYPFVFSMSTGEDHSRWRALLFFSAESSGPNGENVDHEMLLYNYESDSDGHREFGLLPFDLLFHYETDSDESLQHSALWQLLYCYEEEEDGERTLDLGPFGILYSEESEADSFENSTLWRLLHSYESSPECTEFSLGPFGFPFCSESSADEFSMRLFWLFGYESTETKKEFDFIGIPLLRSEKRVVYSEK